MKKSVFVPNKLEKPATGQAIENWNFNETKEMTEIELKKPNEPEKRK